MSRSRRRTVLSLFTGAGGLDLGLEEAGFSVSLCVESDPDCRETLAANRPGWKLSKPGNIHKIKPHAALQQAGLQPRELTLLAGGPPCQPFSKSAYWSNGHGSRLKDPRARTLRAYARLVEETLPRTLILENVRGLTYAGKDEAVVLLHRLFRGINTRHGTNYQLQTIHLNAADYGVPQSRERVFLVASITGDTLTVPPPTHGSAEDLAPPLTAWDAIGHLDGDEWSSDLAPKGQWAALLPSIPEGQNYLWHTPRNVSSGGLALFGWRTRYWSFLLKLAKDRPAWTIQASPGPATGPFHWRSRLLSAEELARLQAFPEDYSFAGTRRSAHRQIGNAVPSALGELLGLEVRRQLLGEERIRRQLRLLPPRRDDCPRPERRGRVPSAYLHLRGSHPDHPGTGAGPGRR